VISKSICDYFLEKSKLCNVKVKLKIDDETYFLMKIVLHFRLGRSAGDPNFIPVDESRVHSEMWRFVCCRLQI